MQGRLDYIANNPVSSSARQELSTVVRVSLVTWVVMHRLANHTTQHWHKESCRTTTSCRTGTALSSHWSDLSVPEAFQAFQQAQALIRDPTAVRYLWPVCHWQPLWHLQLLQVLALSGRCVLFERCLNQAFLIYGPHSRSVVHPRLRLSYTGPGHAFEATGCVSTADPRLGQPLLLPLQLGCTGGSAYGNVSLLLKL